MRVSWDGLLDCLRRFGVSAVAQRLGYLLEFNGVGVPADALAALRELVRPASKIALGPGAKWGRHGSLSRAWGVIENVPRDVLLATDERPKRRLRFEKKGDT